jgi:hypothetical protein
MDWRLIAAVSGAAGSFCFVAVGAYVVLTHDPASRRTVAPGSRLMSEYRFPVSPIPSLVSVQRATPNPFGPDPSAQSPFAPQGSAAPPSSDPAALTAKGKVDGGTTTVLSERLGTSAPAVNAVRPGPYGAGSKTTDLAPFDAALRPELPPVVEVKKSSLVPELHTALPTPRYRGVLTSAEIVRVKSSLRLTPEQERAWPPVEATLAEIGRQQMALIRRGQEPRISPSDWPPGRLYAVAGPLLQTLRPDQKETVRRLCRSLGFHDVASFI